jgi:diaminopropionate ammonia-lyase
VHPTAIQAIVDEGAEVSQVDGSYDDAVEAATNLAKAPGHILVQDMAWDGYEEIPTRIVEGYATMFVEIDDQLKASGIDSADLVIVPAGVGSLLQGALQHYRSAPSRLKTKIVSVEPDTAACIVKSIETQSPSSVPTSTTVMAGLNCGTISTLAWPYVQNGLDGAVVISDTDDIKAAHDLADQGVAAGPCGAAGLAGMRNIDITKLGLDENSVVVILITEGSDANPVPEL